MKTRNHKRPATSTPRLSETTTEDPGTESQARTQGINGEEEERQRNRKESEETSPRTCAENLMGINNNALNVLQATSATFTGGQVVPYEDSSITMPVDAVSRILTKIRSEDKTIPYFYGCVLDWPIFAKKYRDTTVEFQITDDANQKRLDKALRGAARDQVRDLLRNACLVGDVMAILQDTYGGEDNIIAAVSEAIGKMKSLQSDLKNILHFTIEVKKVHLMLRQLTSVTSLGREWLMRIVKLLPLTERRMWAMHLVSLNKKDTGTIDDLLVWLFQLKDHCKVLGLSNEGRRDSHRVSSRHDQEASQRGRSSDQRRYYESDRRMRSDNRHRESSVENYDRVGSKRRYPDNDESFPPRPRIMTNVVGNKGCVIADCNGQHEFADCPKFKDASQPERYMLIQKHRRCPICCSSQHKYRNCNMRGQ